MQDSPIVVLRPQELRQLVAEAVAAERAALLQEVRAVLADLLPKQQDSRPAQAPRLLRAGQMAKAIGRSRASFYRLVAAHPQLKKLQRGRLWPEDDVKKAVVSLTE